LLANSKPEEFNFFVCLVLENMVLFVVDLFIYLQIDEIAATHCIVSENCCVF